VGSLFVRGRADQLPHLPVNAMNQLQNFNLKRTGQGVVLIFSLVFLLVLTMLGVSVVGTTTSEEKMSRNFRDSLVAQSAAEAALRDAEIR